MRLNLSGIGGSLRSTGLQQLSPRKRMLTFFFDNDISWRIVDALKQLVDPSEYELVALREKFPASSKDIAWIPEAGKNGWIVISRDHNQRRRDAEHQALRLYKVRHSTFDSRATLLSCMPTPPGS
jgi:hypothetical protein